MKPIVTGDIGGRLRSAREAHALTLADLAQRTKLTPIVLQALERSDFAALPGGMYRKAYLRMVAAEVGLDPEAIAAEYCAQFETEPDPPVTERASTPRDKLIEQLTPSPRGSIVSFAVLAVLAAGWFMLQPAPAGTNLPADRPGFVALRVDDAERAVADYPLDAVATPAHIPADRGAALWIEITAASWCWIAANSDGDRVLYRLVEPGESVTLEAQKEIRLRVGDAGAVSLSINDGPSRSLGRAGEVVELEVTADNLEALRNVA